MTKSTITKDGDLVGLDINTIREFVLNSPSVADFIQSAAKAPLVVVDETDERHEPALSQVAAASRRLGIATTEGLEAMPSILRGNTDRFFYLVYCAARARTMDRSRETQVIVPTPTLAAAALLGHYDKNFSVDSASQYAGLLEWSPKFTLYVAEAKRQVWIDTTWVYLDKEVQTYLAKILAKKAADAKSRYTQQKDLNQLVNELLKNAIEIIKAGG